MKEILIAIYYIAWLFTLLYYLYFIITGISGIIIKNKVKLKKTDKYHHFAILVAARNEEKVIGNLVESLNNENYPKEKYDVYVIPNNCTDHTKEVAESAGAKILECTVKTKTKGDVLKFVFNKLKDNKEIDAYIIFDADNVVHPDFLMHMNECLASGYNVAEGFRDAKNPRDNWISGCYAVFYLYQNIFFNHARMSIGGSSSINGTGFMIRKELIDERGFDTYTLTEDVEFTGQCALNKERIIFVEDATTYDEYPTGFEPSWKQRKRWSGGVMECQRRYSWKLFKHALKTRNLPSFDMSLVYWGPLILVINFFNLILLAFLIALHWLPVTFFFIARVLICSYLTDMVLNTFMFIYKKKNVWEAMKGIILFPIFIITWIPINIICLIKKPTKWEEIKHDKNININEVLNKN